MRSLPGKRTSGFARWNQQEVFAKRFGGSRARIHWQREERGLRALHKENIAAPRILYSGQLEDGYVLITERLAPAKTAEELWGKAADDVGRAELLRGLAMLVAKHHNAGLRQTDLHLNNFLFANGKIYTLDGAGIVTGKVSKRAALDSLALLLAQAPFRFDAFADTAYADYASSRGWKTRQDDLERLQERIVAMRVRREKEYLSKIFRECSAFRFEKTFSGAIAWDRSYDSPSLRQLLANPDAAFSGELLKKGNTSTVAKIAIDSHDLVVKRYNIKSFWHGMNRAWRRTRAEHSWKSAHRLQFHGVATAKPVALVVNTIGPLRRTSYFIAEYVNGPSIRDFFLAASMQEKDAVIEKIADVLLALKSLKLSHGDLKAGNIVIRNGEAVLLDLDALRKHRGESSLKRALKRDTERLLANWQPESEIYKAFERKLRDLLK